jgi:isoquinoline 1-oxidoreductase beta subunit
MGQGVYTALAMLAAEELDLPLDRIRIMEAPLRQIHAHIMVAESMLPQLDDDQRFTARGKRWLKGVLGRQSISISTSTAGSTALHDLWRPVRMVGAQARATLVNAAARRRAVDPRQCRTEAGSVILPDGARLDYAQIVKEAGVLVPAQNFTLKPDAEFRLIGRSPARIDGRAKGDGSAGYASDVRLPGMRYAALAMPPSIGARLVSFRPSPGLQVVRVPAGYGHGEMLAVLSDSWWVAQQAAETLDISWDESAGHGIDTEALAEKRKAALAASSGTTRSVMGDVDAAFAGAARIVAAEYQVPYLAHATMETMNCTAQVNAGSVRVWAPVQTPGLAIAAAARAANVKGDAVEMMVPLLGGGFGRRLEADFVFQAVAIAAQAAGRPVQMLWTREQDFRHDFYRPAARCEARAAIDAQGRIAALDFKVASQSAGAATFGRGEPQKKEPPGPPAVGGLAYAIAHQRYRLVELDAQLPVGSWRSVGASSDVFFFESFIDELAAAIGRDALELRRELLAGQERHLQTLQLAVEQSGYGADSRARLRDQGRALGLAVCDCVGSVVAMVAEVSIEARRPRVHRVVCAIHCGQAVRPSSIAQQVEGAVIMGMGAALEDGIEVRQGRVVQGNFHEYKLPRLRDTPRIDTHLVPSSAPPTGVGEAALPPVAAAIANAVFALTGKRLGSLPLRLPE